ncbi:MAG: hypothetical protein H6841_08260 [Planctomycetes bacterium]|nr:hypothetical protein [Planctomycetota bacterium]
MSRLNIISLSFALTLGASALGNDWQPVQAQKRSEAGAQLKEQPLVPMSPEAWSAALRSPKVRDDLRHRVSGIPVRPQDIPEQFLEYEDAHRRQQERFWNRERLQRYSAAGGTGIFTLAVSAADPPLAPYVAAMSPLTYEAVHDGLTPVFDYFFGPNAKLTPDEAKKLSETLSKLDSAVAELNESALEHTTLANSRVDAIRNNQLPDHALTWAEAEELRGRVSAAEARSLKTGAILNLQGAELGRLAEQQEFLEAVVFGMADDRTKLTMLQRKVEHLKVTRDDPSASEAERKVLNAEISRVQGRLALQKVADTINEINFAVQAFGAVASQLNLPPDVAKAINIGMQVADGAARIVNGFMQGGILGAVGAIASLFGMTDPSQQLHEAVMEGLKTLSEQVYNLHEAMLEGFVRLEGKLDHLIILTQDIQRLLFEHVKNIKHGDSQHLIDLAKEAKAWNDSELRWSDPNQTRGDYEVMADFVVNGQGHVVSLQQWFDAFLEVRKTFDLKSPPEFMRARYIDLMNGPKADRADSAAVDKWLDNHFEPAKKYADLVLAPATLTSRHDLSPGWSFHDRALWSLLNPPSSLSQYKALALSSVGGQGGLVGDVSRWPRLAPLEVPLNALLVEDLAEHALFLAPVFEAIEQDRGNVAKGLRSGDELFNMDPEKAEGRLDYMQRTLENSLAYVETTIAQQTLMHGAGILPYLVRDLELLVRKDTLANDRLVAAAELLENNEMVQRNVLVSAILEHLRNTNGAIVDYRAAWGPALSDAERFERLETVCPSGWDVKRSKVKGDATDDLIIAVYKWYKEEDPRTKKVEWRQTPVELRLPHPDDLNPQLEFYCGASTTEDKDRRRPNVARLRQIADRLREELVAIELAFNPEAQQALVRGLLAYYDGKKD